MHRIRLAALVIAFVALLGACAQDEEPAVQAPEETAEATAAATPPADGDTVAIAELELGEILVDGEGKTLYVFLRDAGGKSSCTDTCAQTWPPLTLDGEPTGGEGVDDELLGTTEREDGDTQVTYNDRPLYNYSGDTAEGETKGQGIGGNWYVVGADGEPIKE